jgi:hypothetical protein
MCVTIDGGRVKSVGGCVIFGAFKEEKLRKDINEQREESVMQTDRPYGRRKKAAEGTGNYGHSDRQ